MMVCGAVCERAPALSAPFAQLGQENRAPTLPKQLQWWRKPLDHAPYKGIGVEHHDLHRTAPSKFRNACSRPNGSHVSIAMERLHDELAK
jgi:hypothetical protein